MERTKFLVRVVRPVFESAVIEVEGVNEREAAGRAISNAYAIPKEKWRGRFDPENYFYDSHCLRPEDSEQGRPFTPIDYFPKYIMLKAQLEPEMGEIVFQPWLNAVNGLVLADLCSDWHHRLKELRNDGFDEAFEPIDQLLELLESQQANALLQPSTVNSAEIKILKSIQADVQQMKDED